MAVLAGCAQLPPSTAIAPAVPPLAATADNFQLSGRVAVKYDTQSFSGGLRWHHDNQRDELWLSSPLGQGVAEVVRDASGVTLTTADRQIHHAEDAEALTESVLGWRLPLAGMTYWVRARVAPGAHRAHYEADKLVRLEQDGWQIDYPSYHDGALSTLPRKVLMQRADLDIRLVIDDWGVP